MKENLSKKLYNNIFVLKIAFVFRFDLLKNIKNLIYFYLTAFVQYRPRGICQSALVFDQRIILLTFYYALFIQQFFCSYVYIPKHL